MLTYSPIVIRRKKSGHASASPCIVTLSSVCGTLVLEYPCIAAWTFFPCCSGTCGKLGMLWSSIRLPPPTARFSTGLLWTSTHDHDDTRSTDKFYRFGEPGSQHVTPSPPHSSLNPLPLYLLPGMPGITLYVKSFYSVNGRWGSPPDIARKKYSMILLIIFFHKIFAMSANLMLMTLM